MKRKITYGLLAILLLSGLCFGAHVAFGLFTPFNVWTAQQDIKNGKIQLVGIGVLPLNYEQKQWLANSCGFDFYYFGCNVSTGIINGTKYFNKAMVDHLENKFGVGWWTKFQHQLDSIDNVSAANHHKIVYTVTLDYMQGCETGKGDCVPITLSRQSINDSVIVIFPIGGTQTDIYLYTENDFKKWMDGKPRDVPKALRHDQKFTGQGNPTLDLTGLLDGTYIPYMFACGLGGGFTLNITTTIK